MSGVRDSCNPSDLTRHFWRDVLPHFDVYVSEVVLDEIRATAEANLRKALENLINDFGSGNDGRSY